MQIVNLSSEPPGKLRAWLPCSLRAETVVFLPDACPGKSPLPTGVAALTRQADWRRFAVGDCGCGMRLTRSRLPHGELTESAWCAVAEELRRRKGGPGDLGGGNHFLDALKPAGEERLYLLIHTGSRSEFPWTEDYADAPGAFDARYRRSVELAAANRAAIQDAIEGVLGPLELVCDLPHNTCEPLSEGGAIIRKGAVRVGPGDLAIIPSHLAGDTALVRATDRVTEALCSLSHGTGRSMSRAECKPLAESYDFAALRERLLIPAGVRDASLWTEGPFAYRDLDACLALLEGYVEVVERFAVVAYMGHL